MFKDYIDFKVDDFKLRTVRGLSTAIGKVLGLMLTIIVGSILVVVLAFGIVLLLGEAIDSYAYAALIVAGVLLITMAFLIIFRNKLFQNTLVRIFTEVLEDGKPHGELASVQTMRDVNTAIAMNEKRARRNGFSASSTPLQKLLVLGIRLLRKKLMR